LLYSARRTGVADEIGAELTLADVADCVLWRTISNCSPCSIIVVSALWAGGRFYGIIQLDIGEFFPANVPAPRGSFVMFSIGERPYLVATR